ncbi:VWA domain-containing protein [Nitrosophilus kaiyonis]|uniref:VWA domain-containing protein n=1 Tax=Nitrosophilus kaiyonis TaxID=2930200 RepID=UPI002492CD95|nr:VWA domain-containing protein [Nitrosophilus kaiyonis]
MSFEYPYILFLIFPAILLIFLIKRGKAENFFNPKIVITNQSSKDILLPIVLVFVIISMARPVIYEDYFKNKNLTPLFIAIDFSNSMMANDIKPNRLEAAKNIAKELIKKSSFKNSIIIFTTNPLIISPPTSDKEASFMALNSIDQKNILTKGTDFKKLFEFVGKFNGEKNLVVISDGGDFKNVDELENILKKKNIRVFGIGVATKTGALIPTNDGYLKDENKKLVVSRLNENFIELSKRFGGFYEKNYIDILDNIKSKEKSYKERRKIELFFIPLLVAFFIFIHIYTTIFEKIKIKKIWVIFLAISLKASIIDEYKIEKSYEYIKSNRFKEAKELLKDISYLEAKYALGVAYFKDGDIKKALNIFKSIKTKDRSIKQKLYFNIALCYEKVRNYEEALKYFVKSYQLNQDSKTFEKIKKYVFIKNEKKLLLPFSKQKNISKESKKNSKKSKSAGGANINIALQSGASKNGKKEKGSALSKKAKAMPISSKVYELINKGYIDEKNPW